MNRWQELIARACEARKRAYAPYSRFAVGAALEDAQGRIWCGCNVESASYGLTICAERVAIFAAVAAGASRFGKLVVVSAGGHWPCGACRQVLAELAPGLVVAAVEAEEPQIHQTATIEELLPGTFRLDAPPPQS